MGDDAWANGARATVFEQGETRPMGWRYFNLVGRAPVEVTFEDWRRLVFEERVVARTAVGPVEVVTEFVSRWPAASVPVLLFRTTVRSGNEVLSSQSSPDWDAAEEAHQSLARRWRPA